MLHTLWSVKGGAGVTVNAAAVAIAATARGPVTLVDLRGDLPAVLGGHGRPWGPGVHEWFAAPDHPVAALDRLVEPLDDRLGLLPRGDAATLGCPERSADFVEWSRARAGTVVVDAGVCFTPGADPTRDELVEALIAVGSSWLVTRACQLSLHRAERCAPLSDGIVLVDEPGHAAHRRDVVRLLDRPLVARVETEPRIAQLVDAGTLLRRPPRRLVKSFRRFA